MLRVSMLSTSTGGDSPSTTTSPSLSTALRAAQLNGVTVIPCQFLTTTTPIVIWHVAADVYHPLRTLLGPTVEFFLIGGCLWPVVESTSALTPTQQSKISAALLQRTVPREATAQVIAGSILATPITSVGLESSVNHTSKSLSQSQSISSLSIPDKYSWILPVSCTASLRLSEAQTVLSAFTQLSNPSLFIVSCVPDPAPTSIFHHLIYMGLQLSSSNAHSTYRILSQGIHSRSSITLASLMTSFQQLTPTASKVTPTATVSARYTCASCDVPRQEAHLLAKDGGSGAYAALLLHWNLPDVAAKCRSNDCVHTPPPGPVASTVVLRCSGNTLSTTVNMAGKRLEKLVKLLGVPSIPVSSMVMVSDNGLPDTFTIADRVTREFLEGERVHGGGNRDAYPTRHDQDATTTTMMGCEMDDRVHTTFSDRVFLLLETQGGRLKDSGVSFINLVSVLRHMLVIITTALTKSIVTPVIANDDQSRIGTLARYCQRAQGNGISSIADLKLSIQTQVQGILNDPIETLLNLGFCKLRLDYIAWLCSDNIIPISTLQSFLATDCSLVEQSQRLGVLQRVAQVVAVARGCNLPWERLQDLTKVALQQGEHSQLGDLASPLFMVPLPLYARTTTALVEHVLATTTIPTTHNVTLQWQGDGMAMSAVTRCDENEIFCDERDNGGLSCPMSLATVGQKVSLTIDERRVMEMMVNALETKHKGEKRPYPSPRLSSGDCFVYSAIKVVVPWR